ncbi:extracellular solute-binding protein [Paenibacillus oralis]|uniref:Extracellular solute-binding protein n=1 Tax=Paenibacillus oralis TaxID=2490856 RepID=A0A3P3U4M9_9BACL|nr:extracellular solute-binding protein [Paenibacillus oralis]RRJ64609.1 extracellular solute-binding protein [Paenibacillus oralis]
MNRKATIKLLLVSLVIAVLLTACGINGNSSPNSATDSAVQAKKVTLRFFSNLPDRKTGQGLAEQTIIDNYMKENPNVKIEVEALGGEAHGNKLRTYMASNEPIDITMVTGGANLDTLRQAGYVKELNPADYSGDDFGFLPGSFENFTFEDKLYALPRSSDFEIIYYNKKLFADNGIKVPTTIDELITASKEFRAKGIIPMSMFGKDLWNLGEMYQNIVQRVSGDQQSILDAVEGKVSFKDDSAFLEGAKIFKQLVDAGLFQDGFMTADYGMSQNLFTQGKAAMWYSGSWEAAMATNNELSEEFRTNLDAASFPIVEGGKGKATDLQAWNGGGLALVTASKHPEEAKKFFDYMMSAQQWPKNGWELGGLFPAQKFELTGSEPGVQTKLNDMLKNATSTPGISWIDHGTAAFKDDTNNLFGAFASGAITPEQLIDKLQEASDKQRK